MDKERILKFLNLTASSNDNEALSAIKKANKLLRENKLNWEYFVKNKEVVYINNYNNISDIQILKERSYSNELKEDVGALNTLIKYLVIIIIVLIIVIIFILL